MPAPTVALLKEATTYIRTELDPDGEETGMSGSGFVVRTEGTTGYIVTNAHVVSPHHGEPTSVKRPTVRVFFRSGTKSEREALADVLAEEPERDLALLRVSNVANLPRPVALTTDTEPFETMTVFIFGFPFGEQLAEGKRHPPVNVGRGQISSVRRNEDERIRSLLLDGALNPGNSGGPVVDAKGRLVGIARATIRGANIGFAIATAELDHLLVGKAEATTLSMASQNGGAPELRVQTRLLDPLDRIKSARLLFTQGDARFARKERPKPRDEPEVRGEEDDDDPHSPLGRVRGPEFVFGPIERAETIPLKIEGHQAVGTLPISPKGQDVTLWCQVAIVDGSGQTVHSPPSRFLFGKGNSTKGGEERPAFWGEAIDPDGDCEIQIAGSDLSVKVPGTLHDLNIDINKNNGPRVLQGVEGNFVARVKVTGSFQPGRTRTGPKSVPYNGGGLLVWLDEGNYIRLERGAMYRNDRVVGLLIFESRERGTRAEVHNKGGLDPAEDLWLRLERRGSIVSGALSRDSKNWEELEPMDLDWPARVRVGVDVVNSSGDPMTVRFQNYALDTMKARSQNVGR